MTKNTPMKSSTILRRFDEAPDFDGHFHYRSIIGKIAYVESGSRPDLSFALNACSRFSHAPKQPHGTAVKRITHYLAGTRDKGLRLNPRHDRSFEVFVDTSFCGD